MRIAFVVPYVPNLIRVRSYNLLTHLVKAEHDVTLFTLGSGEADARDVEHLKSICRVEYENHSVLHSLWNSIWALPTSTPLQAVYSWNPKLAKHLGDTLQAGQFDVVHVEHLRGSRYAEFVKANFPRVPVVWDSVDCITHLFKQASKQSRGLFGKIISYIELSRTEKAEGKLASSFDHGLVTSTIDRGALLELAQAQGRTPAPMTVLPNGVDFDYFQPNTSTVREPATIVFSGKMSYHANVAMVMYLVREIMPKVWAQRPDAKLLIVGKDPSAEVRQLGENPLVTVTGTVEDVRPFLWRATVAVVPLVYGAGIQNKILEAMACGAPVVATSRTLSALDVEAGRELLVADDAVVFAERMLQLIKNPEYAVQVGQAGLRYVQGRHDWNQVTRELVTVYQASVEKYAKI